jgi:hypothetical protein
MYQNRVEKVELPRLRNMHRTMETTNVKNQPTISITLISRLQTVK